jgi:choline dehydrogenase-like flavoprotein
VLTDPTPLGSRAVIETDVCVIGAGPAGIAFARECIGQPFRVAVLESGGLAPDPATQALSAGHVDSHHYSADALGGGRERGFGGTPNLWLYHTEPGDGRIYARSLPPEAVDFAGDPDRPESGWPLSLQTLAPYYERAQRTWNGGPFDYSVARWANEAQPPLPFRDATVTTKMSQHGSRDVFALGYRDDLVAAENIDLYVGCTVLELEADDTGGEIRHAKVSGPDGTTFSVAAKVFILACGGVENAQLLLLSEATQPGGPGNRHDNVGRYVTDHPEFRLGMLIPARHGLVDEIGLYDMRWVGATLVSGLLTIDEAVKRDQRLLNLSAVLTPQRPTFGSPAERALKTFQVIPRGERPQAPLRHLGAMIRSPLTTIDLVRRYHRDYEEYHGGWSRRTVDRSPYGPIELHAAAEQTADRDNQITLGDGRDQLGRRTVSLRWRWSPADQANLIRSTQILASEIEGSGLGRFERWVDFDGPTRPYHRGFHHPMGSTRMHADPSCGVVDTNARVHGIENLYIAGSSVFSNGHGYANPTLTVLALAVRLADHVKSIV